MDQQGLIDSLPKHLRAYVAEYDFADYTPRDHAVWRFTLRHLRKHLKRVAHPVYLEGLQRTGISSESIPSIDEINTCLGEIGWQAVVVDGFIPPAIFMEFQALRILPIALAMRGVDQILYTPAPDIVHEAAGHVPFLVDIDYAEFLQRFGEIGMRAISNRQDEELYRAIRELSVLKENPHSSMEELAAAEARFRAATAMPAQPSEAALLSRLHWWTVEYGLVGEPDDYKVFGAGLLSSLGESVHCLDDKRVKKLPLTVEVIRSAYDITCEQPQLFVAQDCRHLLQVLETFARSMCFARGGATSLRYAIEAGTVNTAQYDSGMQISGRLALCEEDAVGNITYLATDGPTQLSYRGRELAGLGTQSHPQGWGSPVGLLKGFSRCLSEYSIDELKAHGIERNRRVTLDFISGIRVSGFLQAIVRQQRKNILFSFADCVVRSATGTFLFRPELGIYHMALGCEIDSVFGGAADREHFCCEHGHFRRYPNQPGQNAIADGHAEDPLFAVYARLRTLREQGGATIALLEALYRQQNACFPDEWLLLIEIRELCVRLVTETGKASVLIRRIDNDLQAIQQTSEVVKHLVDYAMQGSATAA